MNNRTSRRFGTLFAIGLVAMATALAGCTAPGAADEKTENRAPDAKLTSSKNIAWSGESMSFDARESKDPDGNITEYRFDFGDKTTMMVSRDDEAKVEHTYAKGGEYTVTVTVFDNGKEQTGSKSDTATKTVAINEKVAVAQQVIYAAPANQSGAVPSKFQQTVTTTEDADRFEAQVDLRNTLAAGSSVLKVRFLSPDGDVLDEEKVTLAGNGQQRVDLAGNLYEEGVHKLEVIAESGGATATGELRVFYDRGYAN